jgi:nickel/cobalt transporter (NicO) family protein
VNGSGFMAGILLVSAIHAIMPTHWLSFVLVARAQKWSHTRMLQVVFLSGMGHVFTTALVGLIAAALGKTAAAALQKNVDTPLPSMILMAFGLYYLVLGWRRSGHRHCSHDHSQDSIRQDRMAVGALFLEMTLSPCETLIPLFFAAGVLPWTTLLAMALLTSFVTLVLMSILALLGFAGSSKLAFPWLERNERIVVGCLLIGLGFFAYFVR